MNSSVVQVCLLLRSAKKNGKSIEMIFQSLSDALAGHSEVLVEKTFYNHFINSIKKLTDNDVLYHITGDINFLALFLLTKKLVLTIHDIGHYHQMKGIKKHLFGLFWFHFPLRLADAVTVVSAYTKEQIHHHFKIPLNKIRVIHNPIPDTFLPAPRSFRTSRPHILQVGTAPQKNLLRVTEGLKGLACKLVIIGKLSEQQVRALENAEIQYEAAHDLPYETVYQYYIDSDIVLFASTHEGFGMPVIEAQSVGRPVITSRVCSLPEVAGEGALFVDPYDAKDIRKAVMQLILDSDLRRTLIEKGFRNVQRFKLEHIAAQYLEVYQAVAKN